VDWTATEFSDSSRDGPTLAALGSVQRKVREAVSEVIFAPGLGDEFKISDAAPDRHPQLMRVNHRGDHTTLSIHRGVFLAILRWLMGKERGRECSKTRLAPEQAGFATTG